MTFSEEAAELRRIEAVAMSLGLFEVAFERLLREVTAEAHAAGMERVDTLVVIRERVYQAASKAMHEINAPIVDLSAKQNAAAS